MWGRVNVVSQHPHSALTCALFALTCALFALTCALFALTCALFALTCALFALTCALFASQFIRWQNGKCQCNLDRIPGGVRDFRRPSKTTLGPSQPSMQWVPGDSQGKAAGCDADHPPTPSSAVIKERVELHLYSPSGPSRPVLW
jgi:hypothetical protein